MKKLFLIFAALFIFPAIAAGAYRSIDDESVPVWDEFVPDSESTDFENKINAGQYAPGEWNWWDLRNSAQPEFAVKEEFFDPNIDYESFEVKSDRERLDEKNMILTDKRSCPFRDTMQCKIWLAEPHGVDFLPEKVGYVPSLTPRTELDAELEKLLASKKKPVDDAAPKKQNRWAHSHTYAGCPFETAAECKIWKSKPAVVETIADQSGAMPRGNLDTLIALARAGNEITAKMPDAAPLVRRYRLLQKSARACCGDGLVHRLRLAGADQTLVYKFLVDDANFYLFGERCLMTTDEELDDQYAGTKTAEIVADVRNECLCRRREYFESILAPFAEVAAAAPSFENAEFNYSYRDGLGRIISVSVARDVKVVLNQLSNCP